MVVLVIVPVIVHVFPQVPDDYLWPLDALSVNTLAPKT